MNVNRLYFVMQKSRFNRLTTSIIIMLFITATKILTMMCKSVVAYLTKYNISHGDNAMPELYSWNFI